MNSDWIRDSKKTMHNAQERRSFFVAPKPKSQGLDLVGRVMFRQCRRPIFGHP